MTDIQTDRDIQNRIDQTRTNRQTQQVRQDNHRKTDRQTDRQIADRQTDDRQMTDIHNWLDQAKIDKQNRIDQIRTDRLIDIQTRMDQTRTDRQGWKDRHICRQTDKNR